jgi:hypothetical protein
MRPTLPAFILAAATAASLHAQNATTALSAIKLLPKGEVKRIARIEAREGNPTPERWYILVHNPTEESGLHEYVVAGGEVVASRALSQFAEGVRPEEVMVSETLRVDSDRAGRLAQQYALANNVVPATLSYQLRKDPDDGSAVWNVTCVDQAGKALGGVVVAASKGNVLSSTGFSVEPGAEKRQRVVEPTEDQQEREQQQLQQQRSARKPPQRYVVRSRPPEPTRQAPPPAGGEKTNFFQRIFGGR